MRGKLVSEAWKLVSHASKLVSRASQLVSRASKLVSHASKLVSPASKLAGKPGKPAADPGKPTRTPWKLGSQPGKPARGAAKPAPPGMQVPLQPELLHPPLQAPLRDLQGLDHAVEVAARAFGARRDLLAGEVRRLVEERAGLDAVVERGSGDAQLGRRGLQAEAVGAQGGEDLVVRDLVRP